MMRALGSALACALLLPMCASEKAPVPPATPTAVPPAVPALSPGNSGAWIVAPQGVGPVRFGMTIADARAAVGDPLANVPADGSCYLVTPARTPGGVTFMVENGRVVRVDVETHAVATDHGATVGHSEVVVKERYGDSLVVTPHKYDPKGRYLTFVPPGPDGSRFRVVFETNGIRVTSYRAGILPAVEYVERCG
jgi:hypothetical protein